jgi:hypothetical protein
MSLANPIQLVRHPTGRNTGDRHQHKQRPHTEPEPAAFRFGVGQCLKPNWLAPIGTNALVRWH